MGEYNYEAIAEMCHQVNKAYCESIGDNSQPDWSNAPDWQKESAIEGVKAHIHGDLSPEKSHELWMNHKIADGWTYGEVKNADEKTHPCIVPYQDLPVQQRTKDYLFKAICDVYKN